MAFLQFLENLQFRPLFLIYSTGYIQTNPHKHSLHIYSNSYTNDTKKIKPTPTNK